tara:strand:- start:209 stop:412 length:204 start_codon:yes stop_codon:yes gene_type:complete
MMKPGDLVKNKILFDGNNIGIVMDVHRDKLWVTDTLSKKDPHALVKYPNKKPTWELIEFLEVISELP